MPQTPKMPTTRPRSRRAARALTVTCTACAAAALLTPHAAAAQQGITFTYQMQSTAQQPGQGAVPVTTMMVRAAGPNMRVEWTQGSAGVPMMKPGAYMVIRGGDGTMAMVSPQDRAVFVMDAASMGIGAGAATNNALVKMTQRDVTFDFEDAGPGEKILGYATRRVRFTGGGTTEMRVLGKTMATTTSSAGEQWVATKLNGVDAAALREWGKTFGRGVQVTNAGLLPRMADYQKQYGDGLALRTVMTSTSGDGKGKTRTDTLRMEVTELTGGRLDPALFELPKDYQVTDMRQLAAAMDSARKSSGADSINAGDALKSGVKGALGGFLKRKKP